MKKSCVSLLLVFTMIAASLFCIPVSAATTELTNRQLERISLLNKLGVIESAEVTDDFVTRGEFATWIAAVSGMKGQALPQPEHFSDVMKGSDYAEAVAIVYSLNCMSGMGATEFGVDNIISFTDAVVATLRLLGYEVAAQHRGGYPTGYLTCANSIGLTKNLDADSNRVNLLMLCYNALNTPVLNMDGEIDRDNILLSNLHNVYKTKGQLNATGFARLGVINTKLRADQVMIGNEVFDLGENSGTEFIGERVVCYYYADSLDDSKTVIYMQTEDDEKLVIKAEDIISTANGRVTYLDEEDRTQTADLINGFDFIYNYGNYNGWTIDDLKIADGELTLIDSDGNGKYDVARAMSVETLIYSGYDTALGKIYCEGQTLDFDTTDDSTMTKLIYVDSTSGELREASIAELGVGDALSVCRSIDDRYVLIYTTSIRVTGIVNMISDEEVVIDGKTYDMPVLTSRDEIEIGAQVTFCVDIYGRLVAISESDTVSSAPYGYFFAYDEPKGLNAPHVMVLNGVEKLIIPLAKKIRIDGIQNTRTEFVTNARLFNNGSVLRQLIRYTLNNAGELIDVYTIGGGASKSIRAEFEMDPMNTLDSQKRYYYPFFKLISGENSVGKYKMTDETFCMVVPGVGDENENPDLYSTSYRFETDAKLYVFSVYDVNDDNEVGAALVYSQEALEGQEAVTKDTKRGIFVKKTTGSENDYIYLYENGATTKYEVNSAYLTSEYLEKFSFGDVVYYVKAGSGLVTTLGHDMDVSSTEPDKNNSLKHENGDAYWQSFYGRVYKKVDDCMLMISSVNNSDYSSTDAWTRVMVPKNANDIAVIDMKSEKITRANFNNLPGSWESGAYIYTRIYKWLNTVELYVYKY